MLRFLWMIHACNLLEWFYRVATKFPHNQSINSLLLPSYQETNLRGITIGWVPIILSFLFSMSNLSSWSITLMKDFQPFTLLPEFFQTQEIKNYRLMFISTVGERFELGKFNKASLLGILILKVFSCKLNMKFI